MMKNNEPKLETIEDYDGKESSEKRLTVWIVILVGLLIGAVYAIINAQNPAEEGVEKKEQHSGIKSIKG